MLGAASSFLPGTRHDHAHTSGVHQHPQPGTQDYAAHVEAEVEHFARLYDDPQARETLFYRVPATWTEVEVRAAKLIETSTGADMAGHLVARLTARPGVRMLSLGSGPGGVEFTFAALAPSAEIVCLDINPQLVALGRERAASTGAKVTFEQADLNLVELPPADFDLIFCHAALHHVIELEHLVEQIRRALRPDGQFITVDLVTCNGYAMWPRTRQVVRALWATLPARFRVNHTAYDKPRLDNVIWEADTSAHGMECIRSEDILPILNEAFVTEAFVPYYSLSRRFFDTMYGPNYDLDQPLDRALFEWLWQLDNAYLASGELQPETFFGIYRSSGSGPLRLAGSAHRHQGPPRSH